MRLVRQPAPPIDPHRFGKQHQAPTDNRSEADPSSAESYYDRFDNAWAQAVLPPVNWAVLLQGALESSGAHVEVSSALLFLRQQPEVPHVNSNSHSHSFAFSACVYRRRCVLRAAWNGCRARWQWKRRRAAPRSHRRRMSRHPQLSRSRTIRTVLTQSTLRAPSEWCSSCTALQVCEYRHVARKYLSKVPEYPQYPRVVSTDIGRRVPVESKVCRQTSCVGAAVLRSAVLTKSVLACAAHCTCSVLYTQCHCLQMMRSSPSARR